MVAKSTMPVVSPENVYVHWSVSQNFDTSKATGTLFTYKGIESVFEALEESWDRGKWEKGIPNLFLFDFSKLDFLCKEKRADFFKSDFQIFSTPEKDVESTIGNMARKAGKQGWSAKYDAGYDDAEYVAFNEYITQDMIIQDKTSVINKFIKDSVAEIRHREIEMKQFIDIDRWIRLRSLKNYKELRQIEFGISSKNMSALLVFSRRAKRLTKAIRILSAQTTLRKDHFNVFEKYKDFSRRSRIVDFKKFGSLFFQPVTPALRF